ncbi:4-hydroxythreonine-4-phosphate dehydrogenase PdxA [Novosphingobium lentum]|uniref:4-hydroxythreonine-4-phosphate dehydrogenase PdxA n=1 Tax=Novosphingobium lentum TaxID=145287 RepID=UPI0008310899|nr:4-hydroxythreonine-4-phosphate dehydrogenase PdxA [Novosphingobium lentum]
MSLPPLRPIVASIGDPAGIGPELLCAAWAARHVERLPPFCVVGSSALLEAAGQRRGLAVPIRTIGAPHEALGCFGEALPVIDLGAADYTPGSPTDGGAALALRSLETATFIARSGVAAALVTAPIAKARLARVGFSHPGQTEFVAEACGVLARNAVMMLAGPSLRVVPITVHVALADVPRLLTTELIRARGTIAAAALVRDFGIAHPRLAVAGLNPHAGEDGRIGREDIEVIAPAVEALRAAGIDATGPLPADGMFHPEARARYDAALCMYHDQALIPLKVLDFDSGVNITLGLPIVRTSPDHGTAFALAGTGHARAGATIAAFRMAAEASARRALA